MPDGFQAFFFQKYGHIVEEEVYKVVLKALRGQPLPLGLNKTYITLIPKVPNPDMAT